MERTFVILKPDAVQRGLLGRVMARLEDKGLKLVACKMTHLNDKILDTHYAHLVDKPFFPRIKDFMKLTPVLIQVWEGVEAVAVVRALCGVTNSRQAAPGTIRGDYSMSIQDNVIHASDSPETAAKEIPLYFQPNELFAYRRVTDAILNSPDELAAPKGKK